MNLGKFIASLLPSFERKRITEDLKVTRQELDETLPPMRSAKDFFLRYVFKSREAEDVQKRFAKETGDNKTPNFVVAACRLVEAIDSNLSSVERLIERHFAEDVVREGMTYVKANLLQYIEHMTFAIRYARHLVLWTYQVEANKIDSASEISMSKGELKWLEDNLTNFFKVYPFLIIPKELLERTIANIPDALIDPDNVATLGATIGTQRLDPFGQNFVGGGFRSPFYHIAMYWAEWQAMRYKVAVEERTVLEFRLLHLRTLSEGNRDAKTEQLIAYNETRLQSLKAKILKIEADAND